MKCGRSMCIPSLSERLSNHIHGVSPCCRLSYWEPPKGATVHLATTAPAAACPLCGYETHRVHSRYTRRLDDLPCLGRCMRLQFAVRRFVCPLLDCPRRIFAERLPGFAAPWARTTDRLCRTQTDIGLSLGGEAGSRLAAHMAIATSPDTLLRRVKSLKKEPAPSPRIVGIDDWAWRKGQRYGTIVVDLERGDVIDLLPDRDADTVAAWLKAHPRGRGGQPRPLGGLRPGRDRRRPPGRAGRGPLAPAEEPA
jgi:transposase